MNMRKFGGRPQAAQPQKGRLIVYDCPNLRRLYGNKYLIEWDESRQGRDDSPWLMQLPCWRGVIYPFGRDLLAVEVDYRPKTARAVAAIPGVKLHQNGDHETTFVFSLALFEQVAAIVRPRRRRRCRRTAAQ
jgi:hypothetical protein